VNVREVVFMKKVPITHYNLVKIFKIANLEVVTLQGPSFDVMSGKLMALVGASSSSKSTFSPFATVPLR
jgi:ABC-type oligopeptide transport system ATPase subunit